MKNTKNKRLNKAFESFKNIEEEFFEIDKEKQLARIRLSFDKVSDVFDVNYITKNPVLSDDFMEWIASAFSIIPSRYKIELSVSFGDYEGYTEEQLSDIFWKNIVLDFKSKRENQRKRNSIAYGLIAVGVVFFIGMILTELAWDTESVIKPIFSYVSDIATTVAFWEAMTILIVERQEQRSYLIAVEKRFSGVNFERQ
ncbi:MAG: hypothetical protein ACI3XO_07370 [Eubacteriales bacterium]